MAIAPFDDLADLSAVRATLNKVIANNRINDPAVANSVQGDAPQLLPGITVVSGGDDQTFVILPDALADTRVELIPLAAADGAVTVIVPNSDTANEVGLQFDWILTQGGPSLVLVCLEDGLWLGNVGPQ